MRRGEDVIPQPFIFSYLRRKAVLLPADSAHLNDVLRQEG